MTILFKGRPTIGTMEMELDPWTSPEFAVTANVPSFKPALNTPAALIVPPVALQLRLSIFIS